MKHEHIDKAAQDALKKRDLYELDAMLKIILGNMVRIRGTKETRRELLIYTRNLKWF